MYILAITPKGKNAKRHIAYKSNELDRVEKMANNINEKYIVEIYNGNWELIKAVR